MVSGSKIANALVSHQHSPPQRSVMEWIAASARESTVTLCLRENISSWQTQLWPCLRQPTSVSPGGNIKADASRSSPSLFEHSLACPVKRSCSIIVCQNEEHAHRYPSMSSFCPGENMM